MKVRGVDGLTVDEVYAELQRGARFVTYPYCISVVRFSFKRTSDVFLVRPGERMWKHRLGYLLISFFLGWWAVPWGVLWTIGCIVTNLRGGQDVTAETLKAIAEAERSELFHWRMTAPLDVVRAAARKEPEAQVILPEHKDDDICVKIEDVPAGARAAVIAELCAIDDTLTAKEAIALIDAAPVAVVDSATRQEAEELGRRLSRAGAVIRLE